MNEAPNPLSLVALALVAACSGSGAPETASELGAASGASGQGTVGVSGADAQAGQSTQGASPGGGVSGGGSGAGGATGGTGISTGGAAGAFGGGGSIAGVGGSGDGGGSSGAGGGSGGYSPCPTKGTPCAILPLGDSITFGYGATTGGGYREELFRKAIAAGVSLTFVGRNQSGPDTIDGVAFPKGNEGYSSYTIDQVSAKVDSALTSIQPNIILMMAGTNDMHEGDALADAPARLGRLIDKLVAGAPSALLVVATLTPANGARDDLTKTFNQALPGVVKSRADAGKHVVWVDMYTPLAPWKLGERFKDSVHPNDAGYRLMAETWYPKLSGLLR